MHSTSDRYRGRIIPAVACTISFIHLFSHNLDTYIHITYIHLYCLIVSHCGKSGTLTVSGHRKHDSTEN